MSWEHIVTILVADKQFHCLQLLTHKCTQRFPPTCSFLPPHKSKGLQYLDKGKKRYFFNWPKNCFIIDYVGSLFLLKIINQDITSRMPYWTGKLFIDLDRCSAEMNWIPKRSPYLLSNLFQVCHYWEELNKHLDDSLTYCKLSSAYGHNWAQQIQGSSWVSFVQLDDLFLPQLLTESWQFVKWIMRSLSQSDFVRSWQGRLQVVITRHTCTHQDSATLINMCHLPST